jgi:hypothetical protein
MKCEPAQGGPCRRCKNSKIECIFRPRANARQSAAILPASTLSPSETPSADVMARLAVIESVLGIGGNVGRNNNPTSPNSATFMLASPMNSTTIGIEDADPALSGLWPAVECLKGYSATGNLWSKSVVSQLWLS